MEYFFKCLNGDHSKYYIFFEGLIKFVATYKYKSDQKLLWDASLERLLIKGKISPEHKQGFFSLSPYLFDFFDESKNSHFELLIFSQIFPYPKLKFEFDNDYYEVVSHYGTKSSIFRNRVQIAYYEVAGRDDWAMKLVTNKNVHHELLILLCLYIHSNFTGEHRLIEGNPGFFITFQEKKFNDYWKPSE